MTSGIEVQSGTGYVAEQVIAAMKRGEPLTELTREEYDDLKALPSEARLARLAELRARPHCSKASRRRTRKHR